MWNHPGLFILLESKGFRSGTSGNEIVYERAHETDERVKIRVYTSIPAYNRPCQYNNIRVSCEFVANKTYTLGRSQLIHPHDEVSEEVLRAARLAYARGSDWLSNREEKNIHRKEALASGGYQIVDCPPSPLDKI